MVGWWWGGRAGVRGRAGFGVCGGNKRRGGEGLLLLSSTYLGDAAVSPRQASSQRPTPAPSSFRARSARMARHIVPRGTHCGTHQLHVGQAVLENLGAFGVCDVCLVPTPALAAPHGTRAIHQTGAAAGPEAWPKQQQGGHRAPRHVGGGVRRRARPGAAVTVGDHEARCWGNHGYLNTRSRQGGHLHSRTTSAHTTTSTQHPHNIRTHHKHACTHARTSQPASATGAAGAPAAAALKPQRHFHQPTLNPCCCVCTTVPRLPCAGGQAGHGAGSCLCVCTAPCAASLLAKNPLLRPPAHCVVRKLRWDVDLAELFPCGCGARAAQ